MSVSDRSQHLELEEAIRSDGKDTSRVSGTVGQHKPQGTIQTLSFSSHSPQEEAGSAPNCCRFSPRFSRPPCSGLRGAGKVVPISFPLCCKGLCHVAFPPCSLPGTLHTPALSPPLLKLPSIFPMLCLASLLLHALFCSQHTNQHKPGCSCMQPLPPTVLSLQCWLRPGPCSVHTLLPSWDECWLSWTATCLLRLGRERAGDEQWVMRPGKSWRSGCGMGEGSNFLSREQ